MLNYIQGKVTKLTSSRVTYTTNDTDESSIDYDYAILATGRNRNWPVNPLLNKSGTLETMIC